MTNVSHDTVTAASVAVEFGVKGAVRIIRKTYDSLELAEAAAARWRRSNSTGDYWAEVETAAECEGHPAGPHDPMGETVYCDGSCRVIA